MHSPAARNIEDHVRNEPESGLGTVSRKGRRERLATLCTYAHMLCLLGCQGAYLRLWVGGNLARFRSSVATTKLPEKFNRGTSVAILHSSHGVDAGQQNRDGVVRNTQKNETRQDTAEEARAAGGGRVLPASSTSTGHKLDTVSESPQIGRTYPKKLETPLKGFHKFPDSERQLDTS